MSNQMYPYTKNHPVTNPFYLTIIVNAPQNIK